MTERFEFPLPIDSQFDRLVDCELSDAEERTLLSALDARPDGWRRCALAFLEARAWKKGFAPLTSAEPRQLNGTRLEVPLCATGSASAVTAKQTRASRVSSRPHWPQLLALATSIVLAFLLGIVAQRNWPTDGAPAHAKIAGAGDAGAIPDKNVAWQDDRRTQNDGESSDSEAASSLMMTLVDGRGDAQRQIEVPLVETDRLDPNWLASQPAAMPEDEVEELRRLGYRVDQQRFYVPVMLDDGRQAIVPLDRANIRYAGVQF